MGGFEEHGGIIGNWMIPSPNPSPRSFFSGLMGDDGGSRLVVSEPPKAKDDENTNGFTFHGPIGGSTKAGLVERMAARAGHNAPRLNTDMVRPPPSCANNSQNLDSPYITIPPGLSPTSFFDSPVFLSNSLVLPSPTTGKFPFASNDNNHNKFEDFNSSSFAFKPVPENGPPLSKADPPPFMSWQSFPSIQASDKQNVNSQNETSDHQTRPFGGVVNGNVQEHHDHHHHHDEDNGNVNSGASEDGYNWRKYGQKQVKGSEYPRSYYKCTHTNCPVKKKVERSHEGHITEIIYKGAHNHSKPPITTRRSGVDGDHTAPDSGNLEATSSTMVRTQFESSDPVDGSLTFSNDDDDEEEEDRATHGSVSLGCDGEEDESESKRRKVEAFTAADVSGATRAIREPRVVVQTTSEVDILDDGYRWRKYGQKVVKGNPNPRSYYKCTSTGCTVRKHVERASHDLKSVITTYEGKHNHDVPAARNTGHVNNTIQNNTMPRPQPQPQHHYGLQQHQHGYVYGMNIPGGLSQMANMVLLGPNQYLGQAQAQGEPKMEPVSVSDTLAANAASSANHYHQMMMMNRMPLGPHM